MNGFPKFNRVKNWFVTLLLLLYAFISCKTGEHVMNIDFSWEKFPMFPPAGEQNIQPGLAGAITGIIENDLIIAGGSNFPNKSPWLGGTKKYYDNIFCINTSQAENGWRISNSRLPQPLAYSACISANNSIFCIGGENLSGPTSGVYKISTEDNEICFETLTDFPIPVSNSGIAVIGNKLYVAGGTGNELTLSTFFSANVSDSILNWEKLPDLPVALSHAVVVSQWDGTEECIFILGGRNKSGTFTHFFSTIWKYSPYQQKWENVGNIARDNKKPVKLAAGTGATFSNRYIILFGGDDGTLFNKTEDFNHRISVEKDSLKRLKITQKKIKHLIGHPGFCQDIFIFNTLTNECYKAAEIPVSAQVTTTIVKKGNTIYIPNGETKPGVRTPEINCVIVRILDNDVAEKSKK